MVMTSQMHHILFEKPRENEYIIIMNGIRQPKKTSRKKNAKTNDPLAKAQ